MNHSWNHDPFQGGGPVPHRPKKQRRPIGTPVGRTLLNLAVTLVFGAIYFYVTLPPLNLHSGDFYVFVLLLCAVYCGCAVLTSGFQGSGAKGYFGFVKKQCTVPFVLGLVLVVTALIGAAIGWEVFRAGSYRDLLTVETGDFAADIKEISYDQIPMLDRDSAEKLGNRKLGELADMVSQFEVAEHLGGEDGGRSRRLDRRGRRRGLVERRNAAVFDLSRAAGLGAFRASNAADLVGPANGVDGRRHGGRTLASPRLI